MDNDDIIRECPHEFVTTWPRYRECLICGIGHYTNDPPKPRVDDSPTYSSEET